MLHSPSRVYFKAYYEGLFAWDQGNFRAYQPWSGHYELCGRTWVIAHITQHTAPGWHFQASGDGSGTLRTGGSYLSWTDPATGGLTVREWRRWSRNALQRVL